MPKESNELYNNYCKTSSYKTVEEFISGAPIQILLQGITITLQTNVKNITIPNEELKHAEKAERRALQVEETESEDKKKQENMQNKQIAPIEGSFGYNVKNSRKQFSIAIAAMRDNVSWFRSFFRLPDFDTIQFFFQQPLKLSAQKQKTVTYPQDQKCAENNRVTRSHTEYFKANMKKSKKQIKEPSVEEKQLAIKQAQIDARVAMIDNQRVDETFVEVVSGYKNQDPETFHDIFNSVFNIVYFQDKQLHEILELDEISKVLEIPQPTGKSSLPKEYLHKQVYKKKEQLLKLVSGICVQQPLPQPKNVSYEILPNNPLPAINEAKTPLPTNIALKSPLKTIFSSKGTCLFLVAASISILCLWHFPLGKVSILKGLVPLEKRESIGLALNIGLITLCVLSFAYFVYSQYSVESTEQVSKNDPLSRT